MGKRTKAFILSLLLLILIFPVDILASWMWLGIASLGTTPHDNRHEAKPGKNNNGKGKNPSRGRHLSQQSEIILPSFCRKAPGLVHKQRKMCKKAPETLAVISYGARIGIFECQRQFKDERWNCSTDSSLENPFGEVLNVGSKETAFTYAITSAGVAHAVTRACSQSNLTSCSCAVPKGRPAKPDEDTEMWRWGGCSDNAHYGIRISKQFVDAAEDLEDQEEEDDDEVNGTDIKSKMNLHNNEVGRQAITLQMETICRCHGVSGSCTLKTCWRSMPSFGLVGDYIKEKYRISKEVVYRPNKQKLKPKDKSQRKVPIRKNDLVHLERSPDYCTGNPASGIIGTQGRQCNKTSDGTSGCNSMCCGRGYNTQEIRTTERCDCVFVWCCKVKCRTCESLAEVHTCK